MTPLDKPKLVEAIDWLYHEIKKPVGDSDTAIFEALSRYLEWIPYSAKLVSDAEYWLNQARGLFVTQVLDVQATYAKELMAGYCSNEQRLYRLAERLNAACVHNADILRSKLAMERQYLQRQLSEERRPGAHLRT